jgi:hypothetical protein
VSAATAPGQSTGPDSDSESDHSAARARQSGVSRWQFTHSVRAVWERAVWERALCEVAAESQEGVEGSGAAPTK